MERRSIAGARRRAKVSADATHQAALAYRDGLMEEAEAAERKRLAAERAANPSRCKCGHVETTDAPMSAHLREHPGDDAHRVVLPLREVRA